MSVAAAAALLSLSAAHAPAPADPSAGLRANAAAPAEAEDAEGAAAGSAVQEEETILVTGRAQRLYRPEEVTSGKLPADPLASPTVINVITEQLIEDQGARNAQDLYRNLPGISFFSYAGVTARGFRQEEIFFDGLRGDPYAGFAVPQLFNIQRVEFLKGPAGMLYGSGAPGGLFNYITKKPEERFGAEIRGIVGTEDRYGGSAEITGGLGGGLAARGALFYEDRGLHRFNAASRTLIGDGGLSYDFGPGRITAQVTRYDQELDANRLRGVPVDNQGNFLASRRWNHNEPNDYLTLASDVAQVRVELQPAENLSLDAGLRYNDAREEQQYHEPRVLFDSNRDGTIDSVTRQFRDQVRDEQSWSFGANAVWSASIGPVRNRVLAGYDYFTEEQLFLSRTANGTTAVAPGRPRPLSLIDPVYGLSDSSTYALPAFTVSPSKGFREGFYLLDELTIGRLILLGGVRYDRFNDREGATSVSGDEFTYRAGAVFRVRDDISLFGQYSTSFQPQSAGSQDPRAGGPFAPTSGDGFEGGVKTALLNGRVQSTLTAYHIQRRNILQADPRGDPEGDGIDNLVAFGEVTSQGVELELAADLTADWVLTAAYAYNDTRITGDNGGGGITNSVGDRFANAPEHQAGFWTRYQIRPIGLAVALGGSYVSERVSLSGQRVKPYTVFDASIIYETGPVRALLRIDNILDATYAASGFTANAGHFPGAPRSVFLEVAYRW
jgi:iron complex outermembrane recepter protein